MARADEAPSTGNAPPPITQKPTNHGAASPVAAPIGTERAPAAQEVEVHGVSPERAVRESPYSVTVVDTKRYAGRATDLTELLNRSTGIKVRVSGGEGSESRLSIRGLEGNRVAVYLNGVPASTDDGAFSLSNIPLPLIERIEVYKGIVPAEFGGDSLGSAVNVVTKDIDKTYFDLGYSVGSFKTQRLYATGRFVDLKGRYAFDASVQGDYAGNDYLMPGPLSGTLVRRDHDRFGQGIAAIGFELRKYWFDTIRLDGGVGQSLQELEGLPNSNNLRNNVQEAHFNRRFVKGTLTLVKTNLLPDLDATYLLTVGYGHGNFVDESKYIYDFDGVRRPNPNGRGEVGFGPNDSDDNRWEIRQRVNAHYAISKHVALNLDNFFVRTLDRPNDPVANAAAGFNISSLPGDLATSSTSLSQQSTLFEDRLATAVGVKHVFIHASGHIGNLYETLTNAALQTTTQEHQAVAFNAGIRFRVVKPLELKLTFEHAARLPTSQEIFGDGYTIQGTVNLKPERADNVDFGARFDHRFGGASGPVRLQAEVSGFYSHVDDLINLVGAFTPVYANISEARILGTEAEIKADLSRFVFAYVNGTYQDAVDISEFQPGTNQPSFVNGLRLPNVPYLFGNYGVEVHFPTPVIGRHAMTRVFYDSSAVARYFFDYELSVHQTRDIPGYWIHTVGLQQTFDDSRYSLDVEVVNLGDALYEDQFARPLPGRSVRFFFRTTYFD